MLHVNLRKIFLYPIQIPALWLAGLLFCAIVGVILGAKRCRRHFVYHEILHPIRERYQRLPSPKYLFKKSPQEISQYIAQLREQGIIHIPNFLNARARQVIFSFLIPMVYIVAIGQKVA